MFALFANVRGFFFLDGGDWDEVVAEQEGMGCRGFAMHGSWTD